ncbi:MAG: cyanophycin synthetase [Caloramator sp.]|nr:cyanophycin synthetase [Caloramator sp.]
MKIIDERIYTGRNIYSHKPCIRLTIDVENLVDIPTKDIENFNSRLIEAFQGLKKHKCSLGYAGGFIQRLNEGTYLPHVFEHVLIEMQNMLGFNNVKYGKARLLEGSIYNIVFQYELEEAAKLCAEYGLKCLNNFIENKDYDIKEALNYIEKAIESVRLGQSTLSIYNEAVKRGIPVIRIGKNSILQLGYGKYQRRIEASITDATSTIAVDISCDKAMTKELLKNACIPVADGDIANSPEDVIKICNRIGYPVVIKPVDGNQGKGVTVNVSRDDEALKAYCEASKINTRVIVEKYIEGKDYRVLVVDGKVSAVALRMPPKVIGDGISSIKELIDIENMNPQRGYGHEKPLTKIPCDESVVNYLNSMNLSLDYIPSKGETVYLRQNANLSTGGTAKDCSDIIHPDNINYAVRAAETIGLDIAGIDICTKDISKPLIDSNGAVIEVNASPGLRMHISPTYGKSRNVASDIIDYLFPDPKKTSIPVISVTGTNGKTTTVRMIGHILAMKGLHVGMTTTGGIYIDNKCVLKGDTTGPDSALTILMDKRVEAAVLETARGGIIRRGLGYDLADVGVITNISDDHLGIDGIETVEDLIDVKSLVAEAVKDYGYVVLNADDESVNRLKQRVRSNIVYFSKNPENIIIKKHILGGGLSVFLKDNFIYFADGEKIHPVVDIREMPSTLNGKLQYNIENAMAACSACGALNVDIDIISKGLKTFYLDGIQNPGRFNVYNMNNFKVVVDYGHNVQAFRAVLNAIKNMEAKRLVGVIGVPGDRMDESIIKCGYICGCGFDYIYIKEDVDKRGRKEFEVAKLLEMGVIQSGKRYEDYKIILNEGEALLKAMENAIEGDLIAVFYEDYGCIMKAIEKYKLESKEISNFKNISAI